MQISGYLRTGGAGEYYLRNENYIEANDGYLWAGPATGNDGYLRRDSNRVDARGVVISFPTQYAGLRFFHGTVQSLCLVLPADAPTGDTPMVRKNGTTYALYLVATTDPDASTVRIKTNDGIKSVRLLT